MKKTFALFISLLFLFSVSTPLVANAQLLDSDEFADINTGEAPDDTENSEDTNVDVVTDDEGDAFTGTFSDEDEDNEDLVKEKDLFGNDEAEDDEGLVDEEEIIGPTHLVKFNLGAQVVVTNTKTETPFMEINYNMKFEQPVEVKSRRFRRKAKAFIQTEVIGELASNELFACALEIEMDEIDVELMLRYKSGAELKKEAAKNKQNEDEATDEESITPKLAFQAKFKKSQFLESWFSNCTGTDGSEFNTAGEKEKYLYSILEGIQPELSGFEFDDFLREEENIKDITYEPLVIEDPDSFLDYTLQVLDGEITIEPYDGDYEEEEDTGSTRKSRTRNNNKSNEDTTDTADETPPADTNKDEEE